MIAGLETRRVVESLSDSSNIKQDTIAQEVPIAFAYNGQSHAVMMASPIDLEDYALGFSLTERIIDSQTDILNCEIRQAKQGFTINLHIKKELMVRLEKQRRQMSGRSSCGICGISDLAAAIPQLDALDAMTLPNHDVISKAIDAFHQHQTLQRECGAVHCAALFDDQGELKILREDIGRHNALDKLIGAATGTLIDITNGTLIGTAEGHLIDNKHFIVMSSRASHELITKTVIAGVNTLITMSAATSLAIDMANKLNLNLIGFVRGERQLIYNQTETDSRHKTPSL